MKVDKLSLGETDCFSPEFIAYLNNPAFATFYKAPAQIASFEQQIKDKTFTAQQRKTLVEALQTQYQALSTSAYVQHNIQSLLQNKTYTITTGHQLNIFTGPLYFIYKIATAINAAKRLKEAYPAYHFVPVYWMASEDHDYEEIKYIYLHGQKITWETQQTGAVGRFSPEGLGDLARTIENCPAVFKEAFEQHTNLADATRHIVNALFGTEGLVVIDADHAQLKKEFSRIIADDIVNHKAEKLVQETTAQLEAIGGKGQIMARPINFFYLNQGLRERLVRDGNTYSALNTDLRWTQEELLKELENHPERFSPNVVMRPLLQEYILPNLAYIGGPAEVVYWLQLKGVFDYYQVPFPLLMPRNFALVIPNALVHKMQKAQLSLRDLFLSEQVLKDRIISEEAAHDYALSKEKQEFSHFFEQMSRKAEQVDKSLKAMVLAEGARMAKSLDYLEKKMKKAEESKHENRLLQIATLKNQLFPKGGLQERHTNFLEFYIGNPDFIQNILQAFDPFDYRFHVISGND
ncbi:bacillithiol biosynthesis cysteine-adding enzyme BshC [Cytophagales bacterium LB-30]|uniref:Putative cysteine ligase BshC n=1 Tax=Shiella aurantiaca TaxID=3058365 RepID=A0ABT8F772_9BACT|nr:bacillithiol biosynthesis cysteine-adding enzyme BshC [Shiella aurantiaca]MDN4166235.1 bacillithiol biosynthesis cysteine-adding enzyme BshC [Shiella aurantiaca]